jgi:hypothetical protein
MAQHLAEKINWLIVDLRTLFALVDLIEHDLEKRIIGRHVFVKIDVLLHLLPRLKNEFRANGAHVENLERLIVQLRKDYETSGMKLLRDALSGHSLKLDISNVNDAWRFMCKNTFGVLSHDIDYIESELATVAGVSHVLAGGAQVNSNWQAEWRRSDMLGDPSTPRFAVIYPGIGTANVVSVIPNNHPTQDPMVRVVGLCTFMRQVRIMLEVTDPGSVAERLFTEIMVIDYFSLWEVLFSSDIRNDYGEIDLCLLDHWRSGPDPMAGATCLAQLQRNRHPNFEDWRQKVRNRVAAHVDADILIQDMDIASWPMSCGNVINECLRVVQELAQCAGMDIRTAAIMKRPTSINGIVALAGREWLGWKK